METFVEIGSDVLDELFHFGVKGMKWGVRKRDRAPKTPREVTTKERPGKKVKAKGGQYHSPSEDAVQAARSAQIAKRSTTDALSNRELQALVNRMALEDRYRQILSSEHRMSKGKVITRNLLRELDADVIVDSVDGVVSKTSGKGLSKETASSIRLGTAVTRAAFGIKNELKNESKKQQKDN